jgi:DNA-cytosine methyltransferase
MKIKLFSMFSGMGGAEFALKKAEIDFETVGYSEIDKFAIKLYDQNHQEIKNYGDCTKINPDELPDFDLLTGGWPCTDLSLAGLRDLSKGRSNLFSEIIRIANVKKPKYMVLENVPGMFSMGKEEFMTTTYFENVKREFRKIGYDMAYKTMLSSDYGVPQNRKRVYMICKLGQWQFMEFMFPEKEELKIKLKDILEKNVDKKYYLKPEYIKRVRERNRFGDHLVEDTNIISPTLCHIGQSDVPMIQTKVLDVQYGKFQEKTTNVFPTLVAGQKNINFVKEIKSNEESNDNDILHHHNKELREYKDIVPTLTCMETNKVFVKEISPTLTTELQHQTGNTFNAETFKEMTGEYRRLTPKECFRLMGFLNDEINISNISDSQLYRIAGNGWDVNLVSKIMKNLFKKEQSISLFKEEEEKV